MTNGLCGPSDSACTARVRELSSATSIDISYDTISHVLKFTALWPHRKQPLSLKPSPSHRTEVGILTTDSPSNLEPHEIGITGILTVLGESKKPSPTVFSVPSRHRHLDATFSAKFLAPTGLHPTLQLRLGSSKPPAEDSFCAIHAYFTLPKPIFADKYQLADNIFLASKNLTSLRHISSPVDLEAPAYKIDTWGSSVLLELSPPTSNSGGPWTAEVPLHFRYMEPTAGGYADIQVPYPAVFWACAAEEGTKFPNNPFDRVNTGYDALFGPRTVFWHVSPQPETGNRLVNAAQIPVLDTKYADWIAPGTAAVVLLGFGWVLWTLASAYLTNRAKNGAAANGTGGRRGGKQKGGKKKVQ